MNLATNCGAHLGSPCTQVVRRCGGAGIQAQYRIDHLWGQRGPRYHHQEYNATPVDRNNAYKLAIFVIIEGLAIPKTLKNVTSMTF